ncbi:MAG: hypothetical protein ACYTG0_43750 [Planctomycetota bacterium]
MDAEKHERIWTREKGIILNSSITISEGVIYFAENHSDALRAHGIGYVPLDQFVTSDAWFVAVDLETGAGLWERLADIRAVNALYLVKARTDTLLAVSSFPKIEKQELNRGENADEKKTKPIVRTCYLFRTMDAANGKDRWNHLYQAGAKGILTNETNHNQLLMHPNIMGDKIVMRLSTPKRGTFSHAPKLS